MQLAQTLGLPVVDFVMICGTVGANRHPLYAARVAIPVLEIFQFGAFAGVDLAEGEQPHRVLLGRTFLQSTVIYDGGPRSGHHRELPDPGLTGRCTGDGEFSAGRRVCCPPEPSLSRAERPRSS